MCKLFGTDSVFLQQASHLTGGTYFRIKDISLLLQTLMVGVIVSRLVNHELER